MPRRRGSAQRWIDVEIRPDRRGDGAPHSWPSCSAGTTGGETARSCTWILGPSPWRTPGQSTEGRNDSPREAPRPERATSTRKGAGISLRPVTFVALSPEQERRAVEALAELLVPLLGVGHQSRIGPTAEHVVAGVDLSDTNPHPGSPATTSSNDDEPLDDDHVTIGHPQEVKAERSGSDSEQGPALLRESGDARTDGAGQGAARGRASSVDR